MAIKDTFISELRNDAALTRKMLERVPFDQKDWKPHPKSMSVGRLATHIADNIYWVVDISQLDDFDFMKKQFGPPVAESSEALLALFDRNLAAALAELEKMSDEDFAKPWVVRRGEQVFYNIPKGAAIRGWALNHNIHHRGQLSVFLRLLEVPVPGMYGPSADER